MIRFLVFSDLHYDDVEDGAARVEAIAAAIRHRQPDFAVSLGDLCRPCPENRAIPEKLRAAGVPFYPVIGNHETDRCRLGDITEFYGLSAPYYTAEHGGYKLIFLNTCYLRENGAETAYYGKNFKTCAGEYPIVPEEELHWLENELRSGEKCIIFSHHSLVNEFARRGVYNKSAVRALFEGKNVLLCMNGHDHGDGFARVDRVPFVTVNSAAYAWLGSQIAASPELSEKYGYLQGMLRYSRAMSAYVEVDDREIRIFGEEGEYLSVTPEDIGLQDYMWNGVSVRPHISSRKIKLI